MRKILLASAAVLGAASWLNQAQAQPTAMPMMPTQGMMAATPSSSPPAGANNNNNTSVAGAPGAVANPTPGTVVIHFNGRIVTELSGNFSTLNNVTIPGTGNFKIAPTTLSTFARIYTGLDAMAANGLRYGGAIEVRENFTAPAASNSSTGASGYSSTETLFVRRAFAYAAAPTFGLVRVGQADGLISLYDNGVTTFQFTPGGNLGGGDLQGLFPGNLQIPLASAAVNGAEYDTNKIVYLSPQFAGFDFGLSFAPQGTNGYGNGVPGSASSTSATESSSSVAGDGSRAINMFAAGARYQASMGGVGVLAYGVYERSGHTNYVGAPGPLTYDDLNFGNGGIALTFAGVTVGGNYIYGRTNGQLAPPPHGAPDLSGWVAGATYKFGPALIGVVGEMTDSQGSVVTTGHTQRHEYAIDAGASYTIAPGLVGYAEYIYQYRRQNGFNFATGAAGGAYNSVQGQGVQVGATVYW
jgi:predicted porin